MFLPVKKAYLFVYVCRNRCILKMDGGVISKYDYIMAIFFCITVLLLCGPAITDKDLGC